jgi:DNA-binding transcriptional MerR regulator
VARCFGVAASTLRYYEKLGLLAPAVKQAGRRWYSATEIRRLATILFWQRCSMMSLAGVAEILDRSAPGGLWQETVTDHLASLREQIERLQRVEAFVAGSLRCQHHECLDDCPDYESLIWDELALSLPEADIAGIRPRHSVAEHPVAEHLAARNSAELPV